MAAALFTFALSLDDFIITYLNSGLENTFPIQVWNTKRTRHPAADQRVLHQPPRRQHRDRRAGRVGQRPAGQEAGRGGGLHRRRRRLIRSAHRAPDAVWRNPLPIDLRLGDFRWQISLFTTESLARSRIGKHTWQHHQRPPHRRGPPSSEPIHDPLARGTAAPRPGPPLGPLHPAQPRRRPDPDHRAGRRAATSGTSSGNRYLDGLSGLFTVQVGHGRPELAEAAGAPGRASSATSRSGPTPTRPPSSWPARLADLAPGDLNRVFFTTGGAEAVESAWKLARQYFRLKGEPSRYKAIARYLAYHGTTPRGARHHRHPRRSGCRSSRSPPAPCTSPTPTATAAPTAPRRATAATSPCADDIEQAILREGPETVAAVFLEPVQNAGGCFTAARGLLRPGPRDLRPLRRAARVRRGRSAPSAGSGRCSAASASATSPT